MDFRTIASRLGQSVTPTRAQVVAYLYGEPLFARPGAVDHYSNSAFAVLTSIIEKASGRSFIDYLRQDVLQPLHLDDVRVGATAANGRIPNEVSTYDDAGFGPSQLDMAADATAPKAYGGQFTLENGEGEGGLIMSTGTVARFLATHAVWEIGPRESGTRYGEFAGTGAAAVSRPDGLDFAYVFNRQVDTPHQDALVARSRDPRPAHQSEGRRWARIHRRPHRHSCGYHHRWIALRLRTLICVPTADDSRVRSAQPARR